MVEIWKWNKIENKDNSSSHGEQKHRFWMLDEPLYRRKRNSLRVAHGPWSEVQLSKWHSFLKRDDLLSQKNLIVCCKYCANHFVKRNNHRYRLINSMNHIPTILPQIQKVINVFEAEREQQNNKTRRKPLN